MMRRSERLEVEVPATHQMEDHMHQARRRWLWLLIVAAALGNELRKPAAERTWHDRLLGILPYDFRRPTWARVKQTVWNPQDDP